MKPSRLSLWDKIKLARLISNPAMFEKLKSRKFWVLIGSAALVSAASQLGIDEATTMKLVALASSYILGQGIADARK